MGLRSRQEKARQERLQNCMSDGPKEQSPTVNQSMVIADFAARTRNSGGWSTHNASLSMNCHHVVTAVAPHFSTKGRTVDTRKTIVMLIIPWLETSKEMCHWYPKLKKKRLILLTKASLRTWQRLSTPQLSQFLCSMKLYARVLAAFHVTQNGEKTCTTSDLMKENGGVEKTKLGKSQKNVEKTYLNAQHVQSSVS